MMDEAALAARLGQAERSVDRVQAQPFYDVPSDLGNFHRYMEGGDGPDFTAIDQFHGWLDAEQDRGVAWRQLLIPPVPWTPYWSYACEWGFAFHVGYEDIRVVTHVPPPPGNRDDFYVIDGRDVIRMHYTPTGEFTGAEHVREAPVTYTYAWDFWWKRAIPFGPWWDGRPELHRKVTVA